MSQLFPGSRMRLSNLWTEHKKLVNYLVHLKLTPNEYKELLFALAEYRKLKMDSTCKDLISLEDKIIEAHNTFNKG